MKKALTAERLREVLHYDPATGVFTWLVPCGSAAAGAEAGSFYSNGYMRVGVAGSVHLAHRLAWFYMTGEWPAEQIDHINGARADNRWVNLREATKAENQQNVTAYRNNTSGFPGVDWNKRDRRWRARIMVKREYRNLGYFSTAEEAAAAYAEAKQRLHTFNPKVRV